MAGSQKPIPPEEAWRRIAEHLHARPAALVPRRQAAGRVLARSLTATVDVPGVDVSAMDGYAVAGAVQPGDERPVAATIAAGDPPGAALAAGEVARIMTGAPVPRGADRVVPVEATDGGRDRVRFAAGVASGEHVRRRGEILAAGAPLLPAGSQLGPGALALLAAHGLSEVPVVSPPRVAVLATGDEVVPPALEPRPGQLRDSNTDFLLGALGTLGLPAESLGIAPDRPDELGRRIALGLGFDVLLLCGGVSMGEFDLVEGALERLGCRALFDAVAIQPGKPLVVAVHERGLVFGLPGNPASVMVSFWLFVRPALRRLLGRDDQFWGGALRAELAAPLPAAAGRDRFLPAEIAVEDGRLLATPALSRGSHDLAAYARGRALVRARAGQPAAPLGAPCEILPLVDW